MEVGDAEHRVERRQRQNAVGIAHGPFAADRSPDVVYDDVAAIHVQRIDRVTHPSRQPRPGVVEVLRPVGEAQPREVEGDRPQSLLGERGDHLPVQEGARGNAVDEHHGRARPDRRRLLADEAGHAACGEAPARGLVDRNRLACRLWDPHAERPL
jgi:hypothetical protein